MPKRTYPQRSRRRKKKGGRFWALLIIFAVIGLGMFLSAHKKEHPEETWPDVIADVMPAPVREEVRKALPEPVKEKIREIKKEEKQEIRKEKAKETEKEKEAEKGTAKPSSPEQGIAPAPSGGDELPGLPAGQFSGRLAVVVDDCGYQLDPLRTLTGLPIPMTYAIIPFKPNSSAALSIIKGSGRTAMLHLPMEPLSGGSSESRSIQVGMTKQQIQDFTREALDSLPGVEGVNNHQGSAATSNGPTVRAMLEVLKGRGLFFVDSRTSAGSVAEENACSLGVPTSHNALFLDNSSDIDDIEAQIVKAVKAADRSGSAVVICHARPNTAAAWQRCWRAVLRSGITLVPVTELLH